MRLFYFALVALLFATPAHAQWWLAETDHFTVYSEGKPEETKQFVERLERFAGAMRIMQKMPAHSGANANRLTIFRTGEAADIASLYGNRRSGVAGFYIPRATGSVAFVPAREERNTSVGTRGSEKGNLNSETILYHEYAHSFMLQHFPAAYPAWYIEGFAELYGTAKFLDNGAFRIGEPAYHRAEQLMYDTPFPVKKLFDPKPKPEDTRHYYSIGWLLTHYLTFSPSRAGQLRTYLSAVNSGVPGEQAAREAFGDLGRLNEEIQRYQNSRLMGIEYKPNAYVPPKVKLRQLTAAEAAIISTKMRSKRGVDKNTAPRIASQARGRAAPYPNDPFVQIALAEAEFDADNLDAAQAAAKRALAADPTAVEAMNYVGLVEMKRAEKEPSRYAAARDWFVKANRQQTDNPEPLINYYMAFDKAGNSIPEQAIVGLERAFELAPFDSGLRFLLARQLLRENRGKQARAVLAPVAFSPHEGKAKEAAEKVLAGIDGNDLQAALGVANKQVEASGKEEEKD